MNKVYSYDDCYRILTVRSDCKWEELRKAYKLQINKWHPDRFHDNETQKQLAEEKIKCINTAYKRLSDYFRKYGELPTTDPVVRAQATSASIKPESSTQSTEATASKLKLNPNKTKTRFTAGYFAITLFTLFLVYLLFSQKSYTTNSHIINATNKPVISTKINTLNQNIGSELLGSQQNTNGLTITANDSFLKDNIEHLIPEQKADEPIPKVDYFTYGSTVGDVISVQGTPDKVEGSTLHYKASEIYFSEGVVVGWKRDSSHHLKVRIALKHKTEDKPLKN